MGVGYDNMQSELNLKLIPNNYIEQIQSHSNEHLVAIRT